MAPPIAAPSRGPRRLAWPNWRRNQAKGAKPRVLRQGGETEQVEAEEDHREAGEDLQHALRQADAAGADQHGAEQGGSQADQGVAAEPGPVVGEVGREAARLGTQEEGRDQAAAHAQAVAATQEAGEKGGPISEAGGGVEAVHRFRRKELPSTETEDRAMAAEAIIGVRRPAAAMGMATVL